MKIAGWADMRRCTGCGRELEVWSCPLEVGQYTACYPCARVYEVTEEGVERVFLELMAADLRRVVEGILAAWWMDRCRDVLRVA